VRYGEKRAYTGTGCGLQVSRARVGVAAVNVRDVLILAIVGPNGDLQTPRRGILGSIFKLAE